MRLARVASISLVLAEEGLGFLLGTDPGPAAADPAVPDAEVARRLRRTFERLGPTFVKFGQLLATRVDLFGEPFVAELGKLHSHVPPFDTAEAIALIESELDRPLDTVFAELSETPVAAASIAQVYRARLAGSGREVAVKVQRPGLEESLLTDLDALLVLSGSIDRLVPPYHRSMVHRVAEEYALRARTELDFREEARAIDGFAEVLQGLPTFRVPAVEPHLCTPRLLVMEWIEGTRLDEVAGPEGLAALGFDPLAFGRSMLTLQLSMAYEHGIVHGDTHPGNVILCASRGGEADGRIALIDFGLHGRVPRLLRDKMLEMIFNQASGRVDEAVEAFVHVFKPDPRADLDAFKAELRVLLAEGGRPGDLASHRVTEQMVRAMRAGARYRLTANSDLFMVVRNLTIVEGILLRFSPKLDVASEVREITGGILRRRVFGKQMQDQLTDLVPQVLLNISQRPRLVERLLRLERAFNQSRSLGDFLREEHVLERAPPAATSPIVVVAAALAGVLLGLVIGLALG